MLALLSDSTNVEVKGRTGAEDELIPAFEEVFARTRGRVLVSCFATSIPRIKRAAQAALAAGRSLGFVGRRMADNADVAMELRLLDLPASRVLPPMAVHDYPAGSLCLFVSGSQGEPFSALSMISIDEHREVAVGPGDTVVLSSRPVPGNERAVSRVISNLFRRGCDVVHGGTAHVHVSGHASQDELVEMIQLVRPRYFVPVHGEYRMLAQHARLAVQAGRARGQRVRHRGRRRARGLGRPRRPWPPACPPAASCSTAPAWTRSRRWSCAIAATSPRTASWCRWSCSTGRPDAWSRPPSW